MLDIKRISEGSFKMETLLTPVPDNQSLLGHKEQGGFQRARGVVSPRRIDRPAF